VAGEVNSDGTILRGSGFTVQHLATGVYQLRFNGDQFVGGCPVMVATTAGSAYYTPFPEVTQASCGDIARDTMFSPLASAIPRYREATKRANMLPSQGAKCVS
jgi:hypothetical protein